MKIEIVNHSKQRILSSQVITNWIRQVVRELKKRKIKTNQNLTIAFVTHEEMKKLNRNFRSQNKVTDVLSFSAGLGDVQHVKKELGELVLCPKYIQKKAKSRKVSVREETAYILLHGLLHLLGFDHEKSQKEARKMYHLQDQIFEKLFY